MPNKPGGSQGKPGGGYKPKPDKPKYNGPVIDIGGMDANAKWEACKFMAYTFYYNRKPVDTSWAGRAVVGQSANEILNKGCFGANIDEETYMSLYNAHPDWADVSSAWSAYLLNL